jgi:hypothetical protein
MVRIGCVFQLCIIIRAASGHLNMVYLRFKKGVVLLEVERNFIHGVVGAPLHRLTAPQD